MPRTRTTKKLAQRIDLEYFKRPSPLRRWQSWLSVAAPTVGLLWLISHAGWGDKRVYSAGSLSPAHAVLTKQCAACHLSRVGFFAEKVSDRNCLTCHDGPAHHGAQTFTPSCASCHSEHRGAIRLTATSDATCTICHANLTTRDNSTNFARQITSFESNHPEFAVLRGGRADPGTIQLNHYRHLQPGLLGPDEARVQMVCTDCHRSAVDSTLPWPYGDAKSQARAAARKSDANESGNSGLPPATRAYMAPVTYAQTCAACHSLQFDPQVADAVPHDRPEIVHSFVVAKLQAYIAAHPEELRVPRGPSRDLPERPVATDYGALTPAQWVAERVAEDEQLLWRKTCKECHAVILDGSGGLPKIAPSNFTSRYMPHANFDHSQHGLVNCVACHTTATNSQQSSDVLLPGIATCRACHHSGSEAAESRCFECHTYHDPAQRKPAHSSFSLAQAQGRPR